MRKIRWLDLPLNVRRHVVARLAPYLGEPGIVLTPEETALALQPTEADIGTVSRLWDDFTTPVDDEGKTLERFQHFPAGTDREAIWRWLESLNPEFSVAEAMGQTNATPIDEPGSSV